MKKLLLFLLLLPFVGLTQTLNIWYIENDTTTLGIAYKVYVKGQAQNPTDTGRIYMKGSVTSSVQAFKIKLYDIDNLPSGPDGTREISFTVPLDAATGDSWVKANYEGVQYPLFVRSNVPDFKSYQYGVFSGYEGFSSFLKTRQFTYIPTPSDSFELFLDGMLYLKIAINDILDDSTLRFSLPLTPGIYRLTVNYFSPAFYVDYTVNQTPVSTSILRPFSYPDNRGVNYFDILGRVTTPKEGDLIRYTPYGAIVY